MLDYDNIFFKFSKKEIFKKKIFKKKNFQKKNFQKNFKLIGFKKYIVLKNFISRCSIRLTL